MAELSEQQIELIGAYIREKGVAQDALHEDLLDHVCTGIENRMQQGESFEDAFQHTIALFGPGGMRQVQQDTFELLTEITTTMKKVTLGFGLTSTILLLAGTSFKLLHWPGAGIMILLGAAFLVLVYFPLLLRYKLKEAPGNETLMHLSGYLGITLATLGVLFKIMHWPGGSMILLSGLVVISFLYVPIYFTKKYKSSVNKPVTLSAAIVALTSLVLLFALTRTNNTPYIKDGIALVESQLRESAEKSGANEALYARLSGSDDATKVKKLSNETAAYLAQMRTSILAEVEGISQEEAVQANLLHMHHLADRGKSTAIIFSETDDSPYHHTALAEHLNDFREGMLNVYPASMRTEMEQLFPVNLDGENPSEWARKSFDGTPAFAVISVIAKLQYDIRQAENQALIYLLSQSAVSSSPG